MLLLLLRHRALGRVVVLLVLVRGHGLHRVRVRIVRHVARRVRVLVLGLRGLRVVVLLVLLLLLLVLDVLDALAGLGVGGWLG